MPNSPEHSARPPSVAGRPVSARAAAACARSPCSPLLRRSSSSSRSRFHRGRACPPARSGSPCPAPRGTRRSWIPRTMTPSSRRRSSPSVRPASQYSGLDQELPCPIAALELEEAGVVARVEPAGAHQPRGQPRQPAVEQAAAREDDQGQDTGEQQPNPAQARAARGAAEGDDQRRDRRDHAGASAHHQHEDDPPPERMPGDALRLRGAEPHAGHAERAWKRAASRDIPVNDSVIAATRVTKRTARSPRARGSGWSRPPITQRAQAYIHRLARAPPAKPRNHPI
jgi:hypothetical protein